MSWTITSSFVTLLLTSAHTFAAEKTFAAPQATEHVPATSVGGATQVMLSLLLVLAAVFAAAWVVRRLRGFGSFGSNAIKIIADAPLGAKERAVLVQVGDQQLLLGVAPGQVSTLHVLREPVQVNGPSQLASSGAEGDTARPDFKAVLKRSLGL